MNEEQRRQLSAVVSVGPANETCLEDVIRPVDTEQAAAAVRVACSLELSLRPCGRHWSLGPGVPLCSTLLQSIGPVQDGVVRVGAGVTGRQLRCALPEWTSDLPPDQTAGSWVAAPAATAGTTVVTGTGEVVEGRRGFIVSVSLPVRPAEYTAELVEDIDRAIALLRAAAGRGQRGELTDDTRRLPDYIQKPLWGKPAWLFMVEQLGGGLRRPPDSTDSTFDLPTDWQTARRTARLARDAILSEAFKWGWAVECWVTIVAVPGSVAVRCSVSGGDAAVLERSARLRVMIIPCS